MGRRLLRWLGLVPLAGLTVLVLLPVLWMLSTSFQASEKMFQLAMEWIPASGIRRTIRTRFTVPRFHCSSRTA